MMLVYGIFQLIGDLRTNKSKRVVDRLKEGSGTKADSKVKDSIVRQKASDLQHSLLESVVSQLQFVPKLQRVLDQADINWSASKLLVNLALISIALTVVMKIVGFGILSCLSVGGGALLLPIWFCNFKRKRRIRKIMEQLPDVFDLMGQALKAGHSLASAIQLV
ncbi:MAG: hypothetical protein FWC56_02535, partial [Phycisphaerae bacterium]|nr:hypothetical protein [Phycisphaerae bacterium]